MKFRFSTVDCCEFNLNSRKRQRQEITYFAFDTQEVIAWTLITLGDESTSLELWLKGVSEPLTINEEIVGTPNFQSVLTILILEFPDIDDFKLTTV